MEIQFRQAVINDVDTILELMQEFYEYDHIAFDKQAACRALTGLIENHNNGYAWFILHNDNIIGYVVMTLGYSLEFQGRDAFLDELFIKEPFRRQGIGQQAVSFITEKCRELGIIAFHLEVQRDNTKAHNLYKKVGFHEHDRFLMTKWLGK